MLLFKISAYSFVFLYKFYFFKKNLQIKAKAILTISNKIKMNKANCFSSCSSVMSLLVLGGE